MSDLLGSWLFFGLPPASPFFASLVSYVSRNSGYWRWPLALSYVAIVFCGALVITNMAYHVREGYEDLPDINWAVRAGLIWAGLLCLPSVIALAIRYQSIRTATLGGLLLGVLSAATLIETNLGFMIFLSFE